LQAKVRRHVAMAQEFAGWVREDPRFEVVAPVPLNLVCFRHRGGDAINERILSRLNASGRLMLTHTRLSDRMTLRMCIAQTNTEPHHVRRAWDAIREAVE
jgi:aromatic-L-amino-acid decarboxylase